MTASMVVFVGEMGQGTLMSEYEIACWFAGGAIYALIAVRVGRVLWRQERRGTGDGGRAWAAGIAWPLVIILAGSIVMLGDQLSGFEHTKTPNSKG